MKIVTIDLPSGKRADVRIERKKMKNCRLKVYPDGAVIISVPRTIPNSWIEDFLSKKSNWIEDKLTLFSQKRADTKVKEIKDGQSVQMYGEDLFFSIISDEKKYIYKKDKNICIGSPAADNKEALMNMFEKWWRKEALDYLQKRVEYFYPVIEKYNIDFPKIKIRKMKTLWGSCSVGRGAVTFNMYLIKAKPACIDYVVLHELVHFIYPNHSKEFYDYIGRYMPDWKERRRSLNEEAIHGLL